MGEKITFKRGLNQEELTSCLKNIEFRGLYNSNGQNLKPYADAKFSLGTVYPPTKPTYLPTLKTNGTSTPLFTAQPTVYETQINMLFNVERFLKSQGKRINTLEFEALNYNWEGRGEFHILPPIIEKHSYHLKEGFFDLDKFREVLKGSYVKDACGNLHSLSEKVLRGFFVDSKTSVPFLDTFNSNVALMNYGLNFNGKYDFHIVCDGSHRIDLAIEHLNEPINVLLAESDNLTPYYALPVPFRPLIRLTSKAAEVIHPMLGRDKIHLLNDLTKKALHYNWEIGGLHVSELRGKQKVF